MIVISGTVRLGISEEELRPVLDETALLLRGSRQKTWHVDKGDESGSRRRRRSARNARPCETHHESSTPARTIGWFATTPMVRPSMPGEGGHDIPGEGALDLEDVALVDDLRHHGFLDVVGLVGILRYQRVEARLVPRPTSSKLGHCGRALRCCWRAGNRRDGAPAAALRRSLSKATSAIEDFVVWTRAPPRSSAVTVSFVTVLTTSGPVTNM